MPIEQSDLSQTVNILYYDRLSNTTHNINGEWNTLQRVPPASIPPVSDVLQGNSVLVPGFVAGGCNCGTNRHDIADQESLKPRHRTPSSPWLHCSSRPYISRRMASLCLRCLRLWCVSMSRQSCILTDDGQIKIQWDAKLSKTEQGRSIFGAGGSPLKVSAPEFAELL